MPGKETYPGASALAALIVANGADERLLFVDAGGVITPLLTELPCQVRGKRDERVGRLQKLKETLLFYPVS